MATPLSAMAAVPAQMPVGSRLSALAPQQTQQPQGNPAGDALAERSRIDYPGLVREYQQIKGTDQGRTLNTDLARELSPEYRADRTKAPEVHEASSALTKRMYEEKMDQPTPEGRHPSVIFTAGGAGSGKSTGLEMAKAKSKDAQNAEVIYDTNMAEFGPADKKIRQALDKGREVHLIYTHRDPVDALSNGALSRAQRMENDTGSGRTLKLSKFLETHMGARRTIEQLAAKYGDHAKVRFKFIDNSRGRGRAIETTISKLPKLKENEVRKGLNDALESARKSGTISAAIHRGFANDSSGASAK